MVETTLLFIHQEVLLLENSVMIEFQAVALNNIEVLFRNQKEQTSYSINTLIIKDVPIRFEFLTMFDSFNVICIILVFNKIESDNGRC